VIEMNYRAIQYGDSWSVESNGIQVFAGLTEHDAKKCARDFQRAYDEGEREEADAANRSYY
jgi:hypothetical protein